MTPEVFKYEGAEKLVISLDESVLVEQSTNGLNWNWRISIDKPGDPISGQCVYFSWRFDRSDMKLTDYAHSGQWIEQKIGAARSIKQTEVSPNRWVFKFELTKTESQLAENFKPSDLHYRILIVDGKKMHVNKNFSLSTPSSFAFCSGRISERSHWPRFRSKMSTMLPTAGQIPMLLELADRFMMLMVTRLCEPFLINTDEITVSHKRALAHKYRLKALLEHCNRIECFWRTSTPK
ncbi:unnamed protein product [Caenorhabditis sp. 36 PRJEB53466]|nr:unnamed protein product [Caenorhabditis sp. 36 PRJEB53466]